MFVPTKSSYIFPKINSLYTYTGQYKQRTLFYVPSHILSYIVNHFEGKGRNSQFYMVGHLFQNYDTIYVRFFPTYTCNHSSYTIYVRFFCSVYLRSFLLCGVFIPKYMTIFLQTRIYMRTKKPIYMRYKQACGICGFRKSWYKRHRIIPSAKNPFMYNGAEK